MGRCRGSHNQMRETAKFHVPDVCAIQSSVCCIYKRRGGDKAKHSTARARWFSVRHLIFNGFFFLLSYHCH